MNTQICAFGTAPEQTKLGYVDLGIEVTGTDESVLNTFKCTSDIRLVRGPEIQGSNESVYYVMKKAETPSSTENAELEGKVNLTKERRVTASVDEIIEYSVNADDYARALEDQGSPEYALQLLLDEGAAQRLSYESTVDEIQAEFECKVTAE